MATKPKLIPGSSANNRSQLATTQKITKRNTGSHASKGLARHSAPKKNSTSANQTSYKVNGPKKGKMPMTSNITTHMNSPISGPKSAKPKQRVNPPNNLLNHAPSPMTAKRDPYNCGGNRQSSYKAIPGVKNMPNNMTNHMRSC